VSKAAEAWTTRQGRHLSYIAEFTSDIRHISGADNVEADTLSRPPTEHINAVTATPVQVDYQAIPAAQRDCLDITTAANTSATLHKVKFGNVELLCDTSGPQPCSHIPAAHRRQLFTAFQSLAHPGMKAMHRGGGWGAE
jgi:hypothetical protein